MKSIIKVFNLRYKPNKYLSVRDVRIMGNQTTSSRCDCTKCRLTAEHQQIVAAQVRTKEASRNGQIKGITVIKPVV